MFDLLSDHLFPRKDQMVVVESVNTFLLIKGRS